MSKHDARRDQERRQARNELVRLSTIVHGMGDCAYDDLVAYMHKHPGIWDRRSEGKRLLRRHSALRELYREILDQIWITGRNCSMWTNEDHEHAQHATEEINHLLEAHRLDAPLQVISFLTEAQQRLRMTERYMGWAGEKTPRPAGI